MTGRQRARSSGPLAFEDGAIVLPDRLVVGHRLLVEGDRIAGLQPNRRRLPAGVQQVSLRGGLLSPGLIDLHVHGGGGADFMDGTQAAVTTALRTHLQHGTTSLFPTTTTGSPDQIRAMIQACRQVRDQMHDQMEAAEGDLAPPLGSQIAGIHLYGPFFAPDKVGCHAADGRRDPDPSEYRSYFDSGLIKIATCAAELPGAIDFYRQARRQGCLLTCGHSNSTYGEMRRAFRAGVRHVDHFWCAMSSVSSLRPRCGVPMQASMEQFVLSEPEMSTEVIADGHHLSPELLEFAYRFKGPQRLCLVTDSSRALDQPPGEYRFGPQSDGPLFWSDGQVGWGLDRQSLASSVAGLDQMVRVMAAATKAPLEDLFRMASLTPAQRSGIDDQVGSLEVGKRADLVVWSPRLRVRAVYLGGRRVAIKRR